MLLMMAAVNDGDGSWSSEALIAARHIHLSALWTTLTTDS